MFEAVELTPEQEAYAIERFKMAEMMGKTETELYHDWMDDSLQYVEKK